ncbi:hypothetical protein NFO65_18415 [Neorhizobium galegae]|uniref:hypothetical protein n=1 Tax=Neorhizobium galegae TaxID=399 RepID=UPI002101232A|nr:hypothetical protein [Neorhizobium galegae]MCQ1572706.1 hypothetical protein [Neorhizobium galegae]
MKFLVTACLLSERLKPRPKPGIQEFFESAEIVIPFATYLTIERGLDLIARNDVAKESSLRTQVDAMLSGCETLRGKDPEIARVMARILGCGPVRHTWLPNEKAKAPAYGHYPWVAAASIVTGIPIATVKVADLLTVSTWFDLPGVFDPTARTWLCKSVFSRSVSDETPSPNDGVSCRQ